MRPPIVHTPPFPHTAPCIAIVFGDTEIKSSTKGRITRTLPPHAERDWWGHVLRVFFEAGDSAPQDLSWLEATHSVSPVTVLFAAGLSIDAPASSTEDLLPFFALSTVDYALVQGAHANNPLNDCMCALAQWLDESGALPDRVLDWYDPKRRLQGALCQGSPPLEEVIVNDANWRRIQMPLLAELAPSVRGERLLDLVGAYDNPHVKYLDDALAVALLRAAIQSPDHPHANRAHLWCEDLASRWQRCTDLVGLAGFEALNSANFATALSLLLVAATNPDAHPSVFANLAYAAAYVEDIRLETVARIEERIAPHADANLTVYHNLACAWLHCGQRQRAIDTAQRAIDAGYDIGALRNDESLTEIHDALTATSR